MSSEHASTGIEPIPDFRLSQAAFVLQHKDCKALHASALVYLTSEIKTRHLAPYYKYVSQELQIVPFDESTYEEMVSVNQKEIKELEKKISELEEDDEDNELDKVAAVTSLGEYRARIGDRAGAVVDLRRALEILLATGTKIDILLTIARIGLFYGDLRFTRDILAEADILIEKGGDWERRNRYKTYHGIHLMLVRQFEEAAKLLVDALATFTSTEVADYEDIAVLAVLAGTLLLERREHKKKIVDLPEILALVHTSEAVRKVVELSDALYHSRYPDLFPCLSVVYDEVLMPLKYLRAHAGYYMRELRRKAYAQLLELYKTLLMKLMAEQFGVSVEFLDADLCRFIPNKRLNCVIDKVNGIVETNRPDNKNAQYQQLVKQGDALLTKLQKYGAAVKLSGATGVN